MTTISLSSLSILIIDDLAVIRQSIKQMLMNVGVQTVDFAATIGDARRKLQTQFYDIVLCDYHMGNGANGQDFLEEIRHTAILPLRTAFFMVTAEASYERVVGVAEVAPDDYMLKPFSPRDLIERVARAVKKKLVLASLYESVESGETDKAVAIGRDLMKSAPTYRLDAARLIAQLLNETGRQDEALALYLEIVETKAVPWARLGLAGAYAKQGKKTDAAKIYSELLAETPNYVEVYDRLAQHYLDEGQEEKAMAIMERAVQITPNNVGRLQIAGQLAFRLGKQDIASTMLKQAIVCGGNSTALSPRVAYSLLLVAARAGKFKDAEQYIAMMIDQIDRRDDQTAKPLIPLARGAMALLQGKLSAALEAAEFTVNSLCEGHLDNELALDVCGLLSLLPDTEEKPPHWVTRLTGRYAVSRQTWERIRISLHDRPAWAQLVADEAHRIQEIANQGMTFVVEKQFSQAARVLFDPAMTTRNPRLVKNACNACLKGIAGGDDSLRDMVVALKPLIDLIEPAPAA